MIYSFPRGSSIRLALENMDGVTFTALPTAKIKALSGGRPFGPVLGTFTTQAQADLGGGKPGWIFTLSTQLPPGDYGVDAVLLNGTEVTVTSMITVKVVASAAG